MTTYQVLHLLLLFGSMLIALLTFIKNRKDKRK